MNILCRFSVLVVFFIVSKPAWASLLSDQRLVFKSEINEVEYRLTLSALKTVNANWVAEREVLVNGRLERRTYEFLSALKYNEAWSMLQQELGLKNYRELYSCDGLSCGSSNAWANYRFEIKQLYGLDQRQKYRVYTSDADTGAEYLVVYFVQRGSKRNFAQVDRIFSAGDAEHIPESSSTILRLIENRGFYSLPLDDNGEFSQQQIDLLVHALKVKPFTKFYVVGNCIQNRNYEDNQDCALSFANKLKATLTDSGVSERRLSEHSVADLVPRSGLVSNRVDLVLRAARR